MRTFRTSAGNGRARFRRATRIKTHRPAPFPLWWRHMAIHMTSYGHTYDVIWPYVVCVAGLDTTDHLRNDVIRHITTPFPTVPWSNSMWTFKCMCQVRRAAKLSHGCYTHNGLQIMPCLDDPHLWDRCKGIMQCAEVIKSALRWQALLRGRRQPRPWN